MNANPQSPEPTSDGLVPGWVPCLTCRKPLSAHIDLKCPFDSTQFRPQDPKLILSALYEMRRIQAELKEPARRRLNSGFINGAQEEMYRQAMERVLDDIMKDL